MKNYIFFNSTLNRYLTVSAENAEQAEEIAVQRFIEMLEAEFKNR